MAKVESHFFPTRKPDFCLPPHYILWSAFFSGFTLSGMGELESQILCIFSPLWKAAMLWPNHRDTEEQRPYSQP